MGRGGALHSTTSANQGLSPIAIWWLLTLALLLSPTAFAQPALPQINTNYVVSVLNYGAVGDGVTTNTTAIQNAINAAATGGATNGLSGGTVDFPSGVFLSGPLTLKSSVNLRVDAGAILRMLPFGQYPVTWTTNGGTNYYFTANNFITASSLHDIEVSGSGAIDGQGLPWWPWANTNGAVRPIMLRFNDNNRLLVQNITLSNSPEFHISISGGSSANSTVQNVTILAPSSTANPPSHNTDACDVDGTNVLVENCNISVGDDDFTCGGGTSYVLLTNNTYGNGHGISIGSYTQGVSNIVVMNCTFNGTQNGIRIKSDNDRSGLVQNISYFNLGMTNVEFPIQVYGYYNEVGTPSSISPSTAATEPVATVISTTPVYRNITFSNINATSVSGYPIGLIWARTELPATNIVFNRVNITGNRSFDLYNVSGAKFIDCNLKVSATTNTFALFNAQAIITNSAPTNTLFTFYGLTTNGYASSLAFYNAAGSLQNTNAFDHGPLLLSASTFTVSNNLTLFPTTVLNYQLSTNAATLAVIGNLTLGGTNNIIAGTGFTNGTYTLMTCTGTLSGGTPTLGSVPSGYNYSYNTATAGQVKLVVQLPVPAAPSNLTAIGTNLLIKLNWFAVSNATSYTLERGTTNGTYPLVFSGLTATNYADTNVLSGVTYYYVVTAVAAGGQSPNSLAASAVPLPSLAPVNITLQPIGGLWQLCWPADHLGWQAESQTNPLTTGLGTNWTIIPNSQLTNQIQLPLNPTNGTVFLRLVYP